MIWRRACRGEFSNDVPYKPHIIIALSGATVIKRTFGEASLLWPAEKGKARAIAVLFGFQAELSGLVR